MLRKHLWRIGLLLAVLLCSTLILRLGYHNLSVRFIADPRFQLNREGLLLIHRSIPDSPRLNLRLAESYLADAVSGRQALEAARYHARLAAARSLWDYRTAHILGTILEIDGDLEGAEKAHRLAVRLAPNYTRANWALGSLLLRESRFDESLPYLSTAARIDPRLYPSLFDQLGEFSGWSSEFAQKLTANDPQAQLMLVEYLLEQSRQELALSFFHQTAPEYRRRASGTLRILSVLIEGGQSDLARQLWTELYPEGGSGINPVWNGDFEKETKLDRAERSDLESLFDWTFTPSRYARISIDNVSAGTGSRSLRIVFVGLDTTTLSREIRQQVTLRPGTAYRVTFSYRTSELTSPEGPRVAIASEAGTLAVSPAIPGGTSSSWIETGFEFTAGPEPGRKFLSIIRQPQFSYDDPTRGVVWFDDFKITELP
ncbi:MAG: tetratricopeptide repeat protein [Acidobacteriota bacterium]